MSFSAFHTQYSDIPLFHHSIPIRLNKKMAVKNTVILPRRRDRNSDTLHFPRLADYTAILCCSNTVFSSGTPSAGEYRIRTVLPRFISRRRGPTKVTIFFFFTASCLSGWTFTNRNYPFTDFFSLNELPCVWPYAKILKKRLMVSAPVCVCLPALLNYSTSEPARSNCC